jgi:uncharacterized Zn-binding protein involved in type VI secretion
MGQPAARVGDSTSHGTPLLGPGSGAPTVLIGGMPAWRAGDAHTCPLVDGVKPHFGGAVAIGSKTVLIVGLPAARVGDSVAEAGPPNSIVTGAINVLMG